MSQVLITLPTPPHIDHRALVVAIVLGVCAVLASIVVEVIRRRYSAKQLKKLEGDAVKLGKAATALLLAGVSALFTGLGYLLVLAQSNTTMLSTLPFVGKHFLTVVGVATTLYSLRLNKTYQTAANVLNKWTKRKPASSDFVSTPEDAAAQGNVLL